MIVLLRRYLVNDTIIIRYCIELVVSTGGALSRNGQVVAPKQAVISVPPSNMGRVRCHGIPHQATRLPWDSL